MKRRTFVRPEAQADIREAATWYETREAGLGLRFVGEFRESLRRIADSPLRFPIVDQDVRRSFRVVYEINGVWELVKQRRTKPAGSKSAYLNVLS